VGPVAPNGPAEEEPTTVIAVSTETADKDGRRTAPTETSVRVTTML
jgi:hypothetical protein